MTLRLLVLGGSGFVGPSLLDSAVERGWAVTVLNRGRRPAPAGIEQLIGDRTAPDGLHPLADRRFDVVVDTWSAEADVVQRSASMLADRAGRYVYLSSRSVYAFPPPKGADETAPTVDVADNAAEHTYPHHKRTAEIAVEDNFDERGLLVRAGLILGPNSDIGRLPWWLARMARGGDVLAPGPADLPLQFIDVRDLTEWMLHAAEAGLGGAYDLHSRPGHTTMGDLLTACRDVVNADATLRWLTPDQITEAGIQPWTELPIWLPPGPIHDGMHRGDPAKALAAGLRCRPATETITDTWAWLQTVRTAPHRADRPPVGLDEVRERAALDTVTQ